MIGSTAMRWRQNTTRDSENHIDREKSMYSITFTSKESGLSVRAEGSFETLRKATNYAKKLATSFRDVVVWDGQPGGMRAYECDAARFGDHCCVCANA